MRLYIGRWEWHTDGESLWRAPGGGQVGSFDLRSLPQMSLAGGLPEGYGLFVYPEPVSHALLLLDLGEGIDKRLNISLQDDIRVALALPNEAALTSVRQMLRSMVFDGDPTGATRMKPLIGNRREGVRLSIGGLGNVIQEPWSEAHPVFASTIAVFRADYARHRQENMPLATLRRFTGSKMRELWGVMNSEKAFELLPDLYKNDGWRPPRTTLTESWNCTDSTTSISCDLTWAITRGDVDLLSNEAVCITITGTGMDARAESDVSSDDHFAQMILTTHEQPGANDNNGGVCCRFSSSARTYYRASLLNFSSGDDKIQFAKRVSGTGTELDTNRTVILSAPDTCKVETDASAMKSYFNGTLEHDFSDTAITGNLRGGLMGFMRGAEHLKYDDWEMADLVGGIDYTLAAEAGAFVLTGIAAALVLGRKVAADAGAFDVAGSDAGLTFGGKIQADPGGFDLVGQDAGLVKGYVLPATPGAHSMAGTSASLILGRKIAADGGAFDMAGQDAALTWAAALSAAAGSFDMAGQDADLILGYVLAAIAGAYDLAGQDAGLVSGQGIAADGGAFDLAGSDAALILGLNVEADAGAFDMAGADAGLRWAAKLVAEAGAYTFEGQDVDLLHTIAGLAAVLFPPNVVDASPRRWKVDAERTWKIDAPGRRFRVDDDL